MPAGTVIGRVSVRVLPDTDDFRKKAQRDLNEIEKTLEMTVPTKVDMSGAARTYLEELRKINARNRQSDARKIRFYTSISTAGYREELTKAHAKLQSAANNERKIRFAAGLGDVDIAAKLSKDSLDQVKRDIDRWKRNNNPIKLDVELKLAEINMRTTQARMSFLARDRTVTLFPTVSEGAAAKAATTLAALSGARVIGGYFEDITDAISHLDKNVPIIGTLALATAGLAGWGLTAASNLFALSASLAQIGPAALALPGILGGIAFGLGATVIAFADFKNRVPEVTSAWKTLKSAIQDNFWQQAQTPIRELIDGLLPEFVSGMKKTSSELGGFFGGLASALKGSFSGELTKMFGGLSASIDVFTKATPAIANIITLLGTVGTDYLPNLAQWVADILDKFSSFLTEASKDGSLKGWIDTGISALKDLGNVVQNTGKLLGGLGHAALQAGGSSLAMLADTIGAVANAVNTPAFQTGLISVLQGAHAAMAQIGTIAGPAVLDFFTTLANLLSSVLPMVGGTIGVLVSGVAKALSNPALTSGIQEMFSGLMDGVLALLPALGPLSDAIAAIAKVIGELARSLGPTLAVFFTELANAATTLAPTVERLIPTLGAGLVGALKVLGPMLTGAAQALLSILSPILSNDKAVSALALTILGLVGAKKGIDAVKTGFQAISTTVSSVKEGGRILGSFASGFSNANAAASAFSGTAGTLGGKFRTVFSAIGSGASSIASTIATSISQMATYAVQMTIQAAKAAAAWVTSAATTIASLVATAAGFVAQGAVMLASMVATAAGVVASWLAMAAAAVAEAAVMAAAWIVAFAPIALIIAAVVGLVVIIIKNWDTIKAATVAVWGAISKAVSTAVSAVVNFVKSHWQLLLALIVGPVGLAVLAVAKHWDTIKAKTSAVWSAIKSATSTAWNAIKSFVSGVPGAIVGFFAKWTLVGVVLKHWDQIKTGISTKAGQVVTFVKGIPGKIVAALGNLGGLLKNAGLQVIDGFLRGIQEKFDAVKGKLKELTDMLPDWKGPASRDATILTNAGVLVMDSFLDGLESRYGAIKDSLGGLSDDLAKTTLASPQVGDFKGARGLSATVTGALEGGSTAGVTKQLIYNAAPGTAQLDSDEALFEAAERARMVDW